MDKKEIRDRIVDHFTAAEAVDPNTYSKDSYQRKILDVRLKKDRERNRHKKEMDRLNREEQSYKEKLAKIK